MNMHGFMTPADQEDRELTLGERIRGRLWQRRWFLGASTEWPGALP